MPRFVATPFCACVVATVTAAVESASAGDASMNAEETKTPVASAKIAIADNADASFVKRERRSRRRLAFARNTGLTGRMTGGILIIRVTVESNSPSELNPIEEVAKTLV
ncbi:unannotated protein [freshwater metagenome]|uniref:Unannotated protein n=1 Tax=freshwater metagenome TaxID=449393 RepID=A0A6J6EBT2_9ZZZZ